LVAGYAYAQKGKVEKRGFDGANMGGNGAYGYRKKHKTTEIFSKKDSIESTAEVRFKERNLREAFMEGKRYDFDGKNSNIDGPVGVMHGEGLGKRSTDGSMHGIELGHVMEESRKSPGPVAVKYGGGTKNTRIIDPLHGLGLGHVTENQNKDVMG
jgi:hypothetical protein